MGRRIITQSIFLAVLVVLCSSSSCLALQRNDEKGSKLRFFELKKGNFSVKLTNWGCSIVSVIVPDKYGKLADVVLGYDTIKQYKNDKAYLGALVGRVANRIGGAKFKLNGKTYKIDANEGNNTLHGGKMGFTHRAWKVEKYVTKGPSPYITFSIFSPDGEEGFPGSLNVWATYTIVRDYQLRLTMSAKALNKPTPVNMAVHPYWNLAGHNSGDILSHKVRIFGSQVTPTDEELIPTGEIKSVKGTPYDFRKLRVVGSRIKQLLPVGYDINYVLDAEKGGGRGGMKRAGVVIDKGSGRRLVVWTTAPGMQFYTGSGLKNVKGKSGAVYQGFGGLALETLIHPDAVNHPNFPNSIVYPGQTYVHRMVFKFSVKH